MASLTRANDALLLAFVERVAADLGLSYPRERWPELLRAFDALARDAGLAGAPAYMQRWSATPPQRTQIESPRNLEPRVPPWLTRDWACTA